MNPYDHEFRHRASLLPQHGIGLSVDVYSPDLLDLCHALEAAGLQTDYLEIFKAPASELKRIRERLPEILCAYHAEGLWLVNPDMDHSQARAELETVARHAEILRAGWVNHECASKQFGGYAFGTYLPPLFTAAVAEQTAAHVTQCQQRLDGWFRECSLAPPLLALELPPLTYFGFGNLSAAEFFRVVATKTSCGFVLDIGHLWTMWRYRERQRGISLDDYIEEFVSVFPVDRVIQIHLAGLAASDGHDTAMESAWWIDAHAAPVPEVLWNMLRRVLRGSSLTALKGVALEVDTKEIPLIVEEFRLLRRALRDWSPSDASDDDRRLQGRTGAMERDDAPTSTTALHGQYRAYARVISGQESLENSVLAPLTDCLDRQGLNRYRATYLPHELLTWGGDLEQLYPGLWEVLRDRHIGADDFVQFWFSETVGNEEEYDFFNIKLARWTAFVRSVAPDMAQEAEHEACALRALHAGFNLEKVSG